MGIRSLIEDLFKLAKESFSLRKLHRYSRVSVQKIVAVSVLLVGATVSAGVNKKTKIQKVAKWWNAEGAKLESSTSSPHLS